MDYRAVVLKCSYFIITLRTQRMAPKDGHAVDKGTASTSFLSLWKGEMKKEEWLRNDVLMAEMAKRSIRWTYVDTMAKKRDGTWVARFS